MRFKEVQNSFISKKIWLQDLRDYFWRSEEHRFVVPKIKICRSSEILWTFKSWFKYLPFLFDRNSDTSN